MTQSNASCSRDVFPEVSLDQHYVVYYYRQERKRQTLAKRSRLWAKGEGLEAGHLKLLYRTRHLYYAIRMQMRHDLQCRIARVDDATGDWALLDDRALMALWAAQLSRTLSYFTEHDPHAL